LALLRVAELVESDGAADKDDEEDNEDSESYNYEYN